jgi:uncharacterized protein (DUF362 family)/ferredoxin
MSRVLVAESTYDTCREAVDQAFERFPVDVRGRKVAIKVNGLKPGDPDRLAYVTHYRLLEAVVQKLGSLHPAGIVVGDSVGTEYYGNSDQVFDVTHLKKAAGPYYRNFSKRLQVLQLERPFRRKVAVLKDVLDADLYISIPKMKTHGLTMISGSVKNNFGLLAGAQKSWYHYFSVKPETFAWILVEMFRLRPPDLVIMDGILAMEGYGPASPETRWVNKILASDDPVALDTVLAKIVGFTVEDVPYLRIARDLGLGEVDLRKIEITGDASTIPDYHRPTPPEASYSYKAGVGTGATSIEYYRQRVAYRPVISQEKCRLKKGCTACVDVCPGGALSCGNELPVQDVARCMLCSSCREVCEFGALEFSPHPEIMRTLETQDTPSLQA